MAVPEPGCGPCPAGITPSKFSRIFDEQSLFQASLRRYAGPQFGRPVILSHTDLRFLVSERLGELGIGEAVVGKNSGA